MIPPSNRHHHGDHLRFSRNTHPTCYFSASAISLLGYVVQPATLLLPPSRNTAVLGYLATFTFPIISDQPAFYINMSFSWGSRTLLQEILDLQTRPAPVVHLYLHFGRSIVLPPWAPQKPVVNGLPFLHSQSKSSINPANSNSMHFVGTVPIQRTVTK